MLIMALLLLIFVFVFAFLFLIPQGKEYRIKRLAMKKELLIQRKHQEWYDQTYAKLKDLQNKYKHIIEAYDNEFDAKRFIKFSKNNFESLSLTKQIPIDNNSSEFSVYEVNATSKIDSPQNFYTFIDQINKSDWIIKVNFPIHFEREGDLIRSSFSMRVYNTYETSSSSTSSQNSNQ
jgi:hypothetical protein